MENEGLIRRIDELAKQNADSLNDFARKTGIDPSGLRKKMKGYSPITPRDIRLISEALGVNKEWLETGNGNKEEKRVYDLVDEDLCKRLADKAIVEASFGRDARPYYDVDFALGFHEMYNDEPNVPSKYIKVPGYEKADFWCRTSGDSMKPLISNGDIIALKEVMDWQSFLPMNEVYAVMTANDLRTVKIVRKGSDDMHITLHAYNEEYEDQEIHKATITKIFKVLGALKTL